jgi:hypothetical protein
MTQEQKDVKQAREDILRIIGRYASLSGLRPHEQYAMEYAIDAILAGSGVLDVDRTALSRRIESAVEDAMNGVSSRVCDEVKRALGKK